MVSVVTVIKNRRCVYMNVRYSYYLKGKERYVCSHSV